MLKPQPRITSLNQPFWDGCNHGELRIQQCGSCQQYVFYPRVCCPYCHEDALAWMQVSGRGRIIAHTVVFRTHHEGFDADAPYAFAAIALDEGPCLYAQLSQADTSGDALAGRQVRATFAQHGPEQRIPVFELIPGHLA